MCIWYIGSWWPDGMNGGHLCHTYDMIQGSSVQFLGQSITLTMIVKSAVHARCPFTYWRHCMSRVVSTQTVLSPSESIANCSGSSKNHNANRILCACTCSGFHELRDTVRYELDAICNNATCVIKDRKNKGKIVKSDHP